MCLLLLQTDNRGFKMIQADYQYETLIWKHHLLQQ